MRAGEVSPEDIIELSVILKPKQRAAIPAFGAEPLSREEFAAQHGADPAVVEKLKEFAGTHKLKIVNVSLPRRTVQIEGSIGDLTAAFNVQLHKYNHEGHEYRGRSGSIHVPAEIAGSIEAVLGFDNRVQAKTHYRIHDSSASPKATAVSYTPAQVAQLYSFPTGVDGTGQTIGILELGGGYKPTDLQKYFPSIGVKLPTVTAVLVDKAKNHPTTANSADGEVLLDIEVSGAVAPGAHIAVYFAPNTDQGFLDALTTAVHDTKNKPSVISISWAARNPLGPHRP